MSKFAHHLWGSLAALALFSATASAEARPRGVVFYQKGDDIFVAGDGSLPTEFASEAQLAGAQSGYMCSVFGVFWAYFSVSDCKPVVFRGDEYWDEPELAQAVAKAHPESEMKLGLWQSFGKYPMGLAVLLGLGLIVYGKIKGDDDEEDGGDDATQDKSQTENK